MADRESDPLRGDPFIGNLSVSMIVDGERIDLTKTEFDILSLLAGKPNHVFTRSGILDRVREDNYSITERVVDYQVTGIRKKLGNAKKYIKTVRGVGYKFEL